LAFITIQKFIQQANETALGHAEHATATHVARYRFEADPRVRLRTHIDRNSLYFNLKALLLGAPPYLTLVSTLWAKGDLELGYE